MKRLSETDQLESRLESLGNSIRKQYLLEGFLRLCGYALLGLVLLFVLDYFTHLPFPVRICLLVAGVVYSIIWFRKNFLKKYQVKLSNQEVSLIVEKTNPTLQSRMISTLQFQATNDIKPGTSENLVEGMVSQTFQMVRDVQWSNAIDKKWVKKTMQMLAIGGVLFVLALGLSSTSFLVFFHRFVSSEATYPTKTNITKVFFGKMEATGNMPRIPEGEKIVVKVSAEGEIPPMGKVSIVSDSGSQAEIDLKYDEANKIFFGELDPILDNLQITITLGDDTWGPKSILVILRPKIMTLSATITPPKYTGLGTTKELTGNLQVFEGSTIEFSVKSDKSLKKFDFIDFSKPEEKIAFTSTDTETWKGVLKLSSNTKYTFQLVDKEDLESNGIPIYTVSVLNDKAPVVKIFKPMLTPQGAPGTKIPVKIQITDDFLVVGIRIMSQIMGRNERGEEIPKGEPKKFFEDVKINRKLGNINGTWDLATICYIKPVPSDQVKIWVEAWDNHEPQPLLMKSQEVSVSIISDEDYRNLLNSRMQFVGEEVGETIKELQGSERDIIDINK